MSLASLSLIVLIAAFISCSSDSGGSTAIISFSNVYDGETFSKTDDLIPGTAMVDIPVKIEGINVGDNYRVEILVNAKVTVDEGLAVPGFEHYTNKMVDNSVIHIVALFPNANIIKAFLFERDSTTVIATAQITLNSSCQLLRSTSGIEAIISEEQFNQITADARNDYRCVEANAEALGLPMENGKPKINGQWYYTYENFIKAMKLVPKFGAEGDENTRKLEIAAFFANVNQETGLDPTQYTYGAGCKIQEGSGSAQHSCNFGGCSNDIGCSGSGGCLWDDVRKTCTGECPNGVGYPGRGPHQLTYDYNYKAYSQEATGTDEYLTNPDLLTQEPLIGISGSLWFWNHTDTNKGQSLDPPFKPSAHDVMTHKWNPTPNDIKGNRTIGKDDTRNRDFGVVINLINGGVECSPSASAEGKVKAQNRVNFYRAYAKILGAEIPATQTDKDMDCANQANFALCPSDSATYPECCYRQDTTTWKCNCWAVDENGNCVD